MVAHMADASLPPATERFAAHVGNEARRRPEPALSRALGGLAALLGATALVALAADVIVGGTDRAIGALFFLVYAAGGFALLRLGAPTQRTAGVTAVAVAVPAALGFLILDEGGYSASKPTIVLALSTTVWAVLHVAGPTRGHAALLAAALTGAWATVMARLDALAVVDPPVLDPTPDTLGPAVASLVFGVAYLAAGTALDRTALSGTATTLLGAGVVALGAGVALAGFERSELAVGLLLVVSGSAVGYVGSRLRRRLLTWIGAGATVAGLGIAAVGPFGDDAVSDPASVVLGMATLVVLAVPALARALGEDEPLEADKTEQA